MKCLSPWPVLRYPRLDVKNWRAIYGVKSGHPHCHILYRQESASGAPDSVRAMAVPLSDDSYTRPIGPVTGPSCRVLNQERIKLIEVEYDFDVRNVTQAQ